MNTENKINDQEIDDAKAAADTLNGQDAVNVNAELKAENASDAQPSPEVLAARLEEALLKLEQADKQAKESKAQYEDIYSKHQRVYSEFENFRKRTAKEKLDLIETANGKLLEKLSEVKDNFDRAYSPEFKAKELEAFEKGISMIKTQFDSVLTEFGLELINPAGQAFDPNMHEAFMQQPSDTVPENHVITVFQKGYKIKDKILKTAKVIVSSGAEA